MDAEKDLCAKRHKFKIDFSKTLLEDKQELFHEISRGKQYISMPDLIDFLENNAYRPTRDEVEAILRRCDHDADGALNYEEFCACIEDSGSKELDKRR